MSQQTGPASDGLLLYRIEAPHFVAGAVVDKWDIVVRAAPILRWSIGKPAFDLRKLCRQRGWTMQAGSEVPSSQVLCDGP